MNIIYALTRQRGPYSIYFFYLSLNFFVPKSSPVV